MSRVHELLPEAVATYSDAHAPVEDEVQGWLARRTADLGGVAQMQVSASQGAFLAQLVRLARPRVAVEIGTFTGYSALCIARALPAGGRLICFDIAADWTAIAQEGWERAGVADRVELRLGPAAETLGSLDHDGPVDLAFIDADKIGYLGYWEALVPRMSRGGLILADNVLQSGAVADADDESPQVAAVRAFNDRVSSDERVDAVLLPVYDGLTVAIKN